MVVSAVVARTLVPYAIHAHVAALDERNHNSGGSDVWLLQLDDGRDYFIDVVAARTISDAAIDPGAPAIQIDKEAWSRELLVDGRDRRVGASRELVGPTLWALWVLILTIAVAALRPGSRRGPAARPSAPGASR